MNILEKNLALIHTNSPHILGENNKYGDVEFLVSKSGGITCKYQSNNTNCWLHSRYEPYQEAINLISSQLNFLDQDISRLIVYGFGCGHHIKVLLDTLKTDVKIDIIETNTGFFYELLHNVDISEILKDERVRIIVTDEITTLGEAFQHNEKQQTFVIVHEPSLKIIPNQLSEFRFSLEKLLISYHNLNSNGNLLEDNFQNNIEFKHETIDRFVNVFENVPFIMVSAGPSLKKNMHLIIRAKSHALIGCVGTALKPLLSNNIVPDFFIITDPKELVYEQIKGIENQKIPMFYLSTVCKEVPRKYQGPKFILYQEGFELAERKAEGSYLVRTGGSVATTLFDFSLKLGFNPICLVGQDLAYSQQQTHIEGAHNNNVFSKLECTEEVLGYYQNQFVKTSKNLKIYLKWFENYIEENVKGIKLYNATEGGAYIQGFKHIPLKQFIEDIQQFNIISYRKKFFDLINCQKLG